MANFNKAFNFRGGFQVDEDVFIVRGQQVGIGSTIPEKRLDVAGTIKADGLEISSLAPVQIDEAVVGLLTATQIEVGVTSMTSGVITATSPAGIVTYYGDGRFLQGLPTSQWVDVDVGLGFTSIYAAGNVGVDTDDPRYAFQVGGVPYPSTSGPSLPAQTGVGIEDGIIHASGIITTRSDIGAAGTIYAGAEFIGVGSNITILNADNLGVGSIGSMRYGDLIVTKEIIADTFIGTATQAADLVPTARIGIDSARANIIDAVGRFISTEGKIQIGDSELNPNSGDIQVKKLPFEDSTIYSIADTGSARVFVASTTPSPSENAYGGIKFGGFSSGDISNINDLDVINYDTGNLNFYLNGGSGSPTTGKFRWIRGQSNYVMASLDDNGLFKIDLPVIPGGTSLEVVGFSTFGDVEVGGDLKVNGSTEINNVVIDELDVGEIDADVIGVSTLTASEKVIVGADASTGSSGVSLDKNGSAFVSQNLYVGGTAVAPPVLVESNGNITIQGSLTAQAVVQAFTVSADGITVSNSITSPNYSIDSGGTFDGEGVVVNSLTVNGASNLGNIQANNITASGNVSGGTANFNVGNFASGITAASADIGALTNAITLPAGSSSSGDFTVNGALDANSLDVLTGIDASDVRANNVETPNISAPSSTNDIDVFASQTFNVNTPRMSVTGDIYNTSGITSSASVFANQLFSNKLGISDGKTLQFTVPSTNDRLRITVTDSTGAGIGTITLPFD